MLLYCGGLATVKEFKRFEIFLKEVWKFICLKLWWFKDVAGGIDMRGNNLIQQYEF